MVGDFCDAGGRLRRADGSGDTGEGQHAGTDPGQRDVDGSGVANGRTQPYGSSHYNGAHRNSRAYGRSAAIVYCGAADGNTVAVDAVTSDSHSAPNSNRRGTHSYQAGADDATSDRYFTANVNRCNAYSDPTSNDHHFDRRHLRRPDQHQLRYRQSSGALTAIRAIQECASHHHHRISIAPIYRIGASR